MEAMLLAGEIGETLRQMYWPDWTLIKPETIIRLFNKAKVRFVLMGTYGINGYRYQARATQDVDILVQEKDHAKAVTLVREKYPKLKVQDFPVVTRFLDPKTDKPVIDLMKPTNASLQAVSKNTVLIKKSHLIPNLEMGLISKFAAMVSPNRQKEKKLQDAADFADMVVNNRDAINMEKLGRLAEVVYSGGLKEVMQLVEDILAGRPIKI